MENRPMDVAYERTGYIPTTGPGTVISELENVCV